MIIFSVSNSQAAISIKSGCTSTSGYSLTTGQRCSPEIMADESTGDTTPRIMYWWGKVNQHIDKNGQWQSDTDGVSGANLDQLTYCKKWYPNTTSVESYKSETIDTWRRAADFEQSGYTATQTSIHCVQGPVRDTGCIDTQYSTTTGQRCPISTSQKRSVTVISPNGGEVYRAGQQITVTWSTHNIPSTETIRINLTSGSAFAGVVDTINDGSETIILPTNTYMGNGNPWWSGMVYGSTFKVFVGWLSPQAGNAGVSDLSDKVFTIEAPRTTDTTTSPNLPSGCTSTSGYSTTSGQPCNLPEGCTGQNGYSTTTGQPCIPVAKTSPSASVDKVFSRTLKLGASGSDVIALQNRLKTEGVYESPITGYFGTMTQSAVKKLQAKYGVSPVGIVGPETLRALNR